MALLELRSDVAGVVVAIEVAEGAGVAEGDAVVVLESMKMEIVFAAPAAGRVASIAVAPGDPVSDGDVLALIEG